MKITELKSLTGEKDKYRALSKIKERLESRIWRDAAGRVYRITGLNFKFVSLMHLENVSHGVAAYKAARVYLDDAIDCITGRFHGIALWL